MLLNYDKSRARDSLMWRIGTTAQDVAKQRRSGDSGASAKHLNVEVANLLPQCVAIYAQQIGRPNLISAGCGQRNRQKGMFHFAQDAMVEPWRGQLRAKAREVRRQVPLDRRCQAIVRLRVTLRRRHTDLGKLSV